MIGRLVEAFCCRQLSYGRLAANMFNIITWFIGVFIQYSTKTRGKTIVVLINQMLETDERLDRTLIKL